METRDMDIRVRSARESTCRGLTGDGEAAAIELRICVAMSGDGGEEGGMVV
jgi:hypothetical protein